MGHEVAAVDLLDLVQVDRVDQDAALAFEGVRELHAPYGEDLLTILTGRDDNGGRILDRPGRDPDEVRGSPRCLGIDVQGRRADDDILNPENTYQILHERIACHLNRHTHPPFCRLVQRDPRSPQPHFLASFNPKTSRSVKNLSPFRLWA